MKPIKKFFSYLTLKAFTVPSRRKSIFVGTFFVLLVLSALRLFDIRIIESIPLATQAMTIFIYALLTNVIASGARLFVVSAHRKRHGIEGDEKDNFTLGVNSLVTALTGIGTIVAIFIVFEIEFYSFLTSIALFAVALTMVFQDFIKNFLHGLVMMFSEDYQIGDYVQVGHYPKGIVRDISFSTTKLRTDEGNILFIPNQIFRTSEVINYSKIKYKRITPQFIILRSNLVSFTDLEKKLFKFIDNTLTEQLVEDKTLLTITETSKDEIRFSLDLTVHAYSFNLEKEIKKMVQIFALEYTTKNQPKQSLTADLKRD